MNKKRPLSYPAPRPAKRTFNPLQNIPEPPKAKEAFDIFFGGNFMRGWFKKISVHGLFPLALGTILALTGPKAMPIKSIAVLVFALWLSLDIGVEIAERKWNKHLKIILFCVSTCLCFCIAMLVMRSFLVQVLADQQDEVAKGLRPGVTTPRASDPWGTVFSVTNNSPFRLANADISCFLHRVVDLNANEFLGKWRKTPPTGTVEPSGDVSTNDCLNNVTDAYAVVCADVEMQFSYHLETQPAIENKIRYRFVGEPQNGLFQWIQKSLDKKDSYCAKQHLPPLR